MFGMYEYLKVMYLVLLVSIMSLNSLSTLKIPQLELMCVVSYSIRNFFFLLLFDLKLTKSAFFFYKTTLWGLVSPSMVTVDGYSYNQ